MILLSASKVWLVVQRDGGIWSFPTWTKNRLSLLRHPEVSREIVEETLLILQESQYYFLLELVDAVPREDVLRSWSPPRSLIRPSAIGRINSPFSLGNITSFAMSFFWVDFRCVHRFQLLKVCNQYVTLPNTSPRTERIRRTIQVKLFQIDGFVTDPSHF